MGNGPWKVTSDSNQEFFVHMGEEVKLIPWDMRIEKQ